jgi:hypothetical protein
VGQAGEEGEEEGGVGELHGEEGSKKTRGREVTRAGGLTLP